jgi:hypothetical protein
LLSRNVPSIYTFDIFPGPNGPTIKKNEESNAFRGKLVFIPLHSSLLGFSGNVAFPRLGGCGLCRESVEWRIVGTVGARYLSVGRSLRQLRGDMKREAMKAAWTRVPCWP